jgi:hypothetical protein
VLENMRAKARRADIMFDALVTHMNEALKIEKPNHYTQKVEAPQWL